MKALKIWHLNSNRWYSAISAYAISAAQSLSLRGHHCVFTPLLSSPAESIAFKSKLSVNSLSGFKLKNFYSFYLLAQKIRPDLIIVYGGQEEVLCRLLPASLRPRLVRFRGQNLEISSLIKEKIFKYSQSHLDLTISPSDRIKKCLESFSLKENKISQVQLGIDGDKFYLPRLSKDEKKRPEVLIFGRLDPIKGHKEFIDFFSKYLKNQDSIRNGSLQPCLHIAGSEANVTHKELKEHCVEKGLSIGSDVKFTNLHIKNLSTLLGAAALGLVTSLGSEEICRVAQEFLMCGTQVLVSGVGGLEEVLFEGAGQSYRGKKIDERFEQFSSMIKNSLEEGSAKKEKRAELARELFSLQTMGQKLEEAFDPVMGID